MGRDQRRHPGLADQPQQPLSLGFLGRSLASTRALLAEGFGIELTDAALAAIDRGDGRAALALLLRDQDDWARIPPPSMEEAGRIADAIGRMTLREAMAALNFGPVAHYFAHRWSAPTFLSALGLLETRWTDPPLVLEIACGIGQILRDLDRRGTAVAGIDVVFAKLWLAKTFLLPDAPLVCADVTSGIPLELPEGTSILCHDAFYFMPEQERIAHDTIADVNASGLWPGKAATSIEPVGPFWEAEPEHQDYLEKYPNGYTCHFPRDGWVLPERRSPSVAT